MPAVSMKSSSHRSALSGAIVFNPRRTMEVSTMLAADMIGSSSAAMRWAKRAASSSWRKMAMTAELSTTIIRQPVLVITENFVWGPSGVGQGRITLADLHQSCRDLVGAPAAALAGQAFAQRHGDRGGQVLA